MIAGVGLAGTDEGSVLDGVVEVTGIVVSTAEIGAPLSVELRRDTLYLLSPVSAGFAAGSDRSVADSSG